MRCNAVLYVLLFALFPFLCVRKEVDQDNAVLSPCGKLDDQPSGLDQKNPTKPVVFLLIFREPLRCSFET